MNRQRFCKHGHDTDVCGRDKRYNCKECRKHKNRKPENKARRKAYRQSATGKAYKLKAQANTYSLSPSEYLEMKSRPCEICGGFTTKDGAGGMHIDHDHVRDKVRGTLCCNCNKGLGMFKDNESHLIEAAFYLRKYNAD